MFIGDIMLNKSILEICEELENVDSITSKDFNEIYLKFYSSLIGSLKTKNYADKKETLDLAYLLIHIKVKTNSKNEQANINLKKKEITNAITNLQNSKIR